MNRSEAWGVLDFVEKIKAMGVAPASLVLALLTGAKEDMTIIVRAFADGLDVTHKGLIKQDPGFGGQADDYRVIQKPDGSDIVRELLLSNKEVFCCASSESQEDADAQASGSYDCGIWLIVAHDNGSAIHGGAFITGSGAEWKYAAQVDVGKITAAAS
jgi:hypothetical protein